MKYLGSITVPTVVYPKRFTGQALRRTFLCGLDELTGKDYSHRKDWMEKRLLELSNVFSIEIFAFCIMSNHYHAVLYVNPLEPQNWSKEEVAERWLKAYSGRLDNPKFAKQRELKKQAIIADKEKIALYRQRLGDLSWFMRRLNEPIAKMSNDEDYCTGRFWEGRFFSQALLDEAAVFSAMAYVDLNPIRAKITQRLEDSHNTSIKKRIESLAEKPPEESQIELNRSISAISNNIKSKKLSLSIKDYIALVEWAVYRSCVNGIYHVHVKNWEVIRLPQQSRYASAYQILPI